MSGLTNLSIICGRLKRIFFDPLEQKQKIRKQILEIQDSVRNHMEFRTMNQYNAWSEVLIRYSLKLQSKLQRKYRKKFGEFPFEIVEVPE